MCKKVEFQVKVPKSKIGTKIEYKGADRLTYVHNLSSEKSKIYVYKNNISKVIDLLDEEKLTYKYNDEDTQETK